VRVNKVYSVVRNDRNWWLLEDLQNGARGYVPKTHLITMTGIPVSLIFRSRSDEDRHDTASAPGFFVSSWASSPVAAAGPVTADRSRAAGQPSAGPTSGLLPPPAGPTPGLLPPPSGPTPGLLPPPPPPPPSKDVIGDGTLSNNGGGGLAALLKSAKDKQKAVPSTREYDPTAIAGAVTVERLGR